MAASHDRPRIDYAGLFAGSDAVLVDPAEVEVVRLPALYVPRGALVGFDPTNIGAYDLDYAPYEATIAPGLYAGRACVDRATRHIAATWLQIRRAEVVRWQLAAPADDALAGMPLHQPGTAFGYECRGFGGLADASALARHVRDPVWLRDALERELLTGDEHHAAIALDDAGANLWALRVHDGGPCRAYWGFDQRGELVALVSDFFSEFHGARLRAPPRRG